MGLSVFKLVLVALTLIAKLHYTDTDILYNTTNGQKFATSQCQRPTSPHVKMLGCGKFLSVGGEFLVQQVVELFL